MFPQKPGDSIDADASFDIPRDSSNRAFFCLGFKRIYELFLPHLLQNFMDVRLELSIKA